MSEIKKVIQNTDDLGFVLSELVICDDGNMIIDYRPPYSRTKVEDD